MKLAEIVADMAREGRQPAQVIAAFKAALDAVEELQKQIAALETAPQGKTPAKDRR